MDEKTIKNGKTENPIILPDDESAAKLLLSSKKFFNARNSWDITNTRKDIQVSSIKTPSSSLKDIRRRSSTLWDLQKTKVPEGTEIMHYKRRWIMLIIFVFYGVVVTFQWSMYSIIANIITKYYKVSNLMVDFTNMSFLIGYNIVFLPACWCLNTLGLRWSLVLGCAGNFVGCLLRVFSVEADRFWMTMLGQCVVAVFQVFMPMIPARLAAVWFPAHQVSLACSIGFNGILIGNAVGFLIPPLMVRNSDNLEDIGADLNFMYISLAVASLVCLLLTLGFFQEEPPLPPSQAQKFQRTKHESAKQEGADSSKEFIASLKRLFKKKAYLLLLVSFSLNVGLFCAIAALLNQVLIPHFPGREAEVGAVGLVLVVSGIVSSIICGYILDRTHAFKKTTMVLYLLALVGWIAFTLLIHGGDMTWIFIATGVLGFATTGVQPVGLEFSVEITFPEPEGTSSGLIIAFVQIFGVVFTLVYGYMLEAWGDNVANWIMAIPLAVACLCLVFMRPKLKRQAAQQLKTSQHIQVESC